MALGKCKVRSNQGFVPRLSQQPRKTQKAWKSEELKRQSAICASAAAECASKSAKWQRREHVDHKRTTEDVCSRYGYAPVTAAQVLVR